MFGLRSEIEFCPCAGPAKRRKAANAQRQMKERGIWERSWRGNAKANALHRTSTRSQVTDKERSVLCRKSLAKLQLAPGGLPKCRWRNRLGGALFRNSLSQLRCLGFCPH